MIIWRRGKIIKHLKTWGAASEYEVQLADGRSGKALAYHNMVGIPQVTEEVLLSAAAVEKNLGTGGYLLIVAIPERLPADPPPQIGHLVKARYTPSQFMIQGVDEQDSPFHTQLAEADSILGMPVIATDLHSALPAIVHGIYTQQPDAKITYIMTDGGALPVWFSQLIAQLKAHNALTGVISCGQAFGGDLEAVNIYTALLAAKHVLEADYAIVTQGPGNLGTGTKWGFSGTQIGEVLNAAGILQGVPIAAARMSNGDLRERHYGISHHTLRILADIVHVPCHFPVPQLESLECITSELATTVQAQLNTLGEKNNIHPVAVTSADALTKLRDCPYSLSTMRRNLDTDPLAFIAAFVAGKYAVNLKPAK